MAFDPFNIDAKKEAQRNLQGLVKKHGRESDRMQSAFIALQESRDGLSQTLREVESQINRFKNTPENLKKDVEKLSISLERYEKLLAEAQSESVSVARGAGAGVAAGVAAGGAVAAFGGTALTALAMSIGTASTGATIAGLSGAAATNAALAWLGGGAIAAGGAGIAGGEALLALTGPIGWAIGGTIAVSTGLWARGKNAEAVKNMKADAKKVSAGINGIRAIISEVKAHNKLTVSTREGLNSQTDVVSKFPDDFKDFSEEQINQIGGLVNNALTGETILNAKLGKNGRFESK